MNGIKNDSYTVYEHINKINGMRYIGCTSKQPPSLRWNNGYGYNNGQEKFFTAIKKYGWNNFEHVIVASGLNKQEALALEEKRIKEYDTVLTGYNSAYGGEKNYLSEASKIKLRQKRLGNKNPNYNPNKTTDRYYRSRIKSINEQMSQEEKEKMMLRKKENYRNSKLGEKNPNYGKLSWNHNKKLTESQKINIYKSWTEERRKLARQQKLGNKNPQAKRVLCVSTGIIYDTIVDAAKMNNVSERTVSASCNGESKNPRIKFVFVKEGGLK